MQVDHGAGGPRRPPIGGRLELIKQSGPASPVDLATDPRPRPAALASGGGMTMALQERHASAEHAVELPEPWRSAAVTVVLPTYNEAANLPVIVAELLGLPLTNLQHPRRRRQLARRHRATSPTGWSRSTAQGRITVVHRQEKQGLGRAYVDGMTRAMAAGAEFVVQMDSDLSHAPAYVPQMLGTLFVRRRRRGDRLPVRGRGQPGRRVGLAPQGPVRLRQRLRPRAAAAGHPRRHRRVQDLAHHRRCRPSTWPASAATATASRSR